jgi:hypothetical protein
MVIDGNPRSRWRVGLFFPALLAACASADDAPNDSRDAPEHPVLASPTTGDVATASEPDYENVPEPTTPIDERVQEFENDGLGVYDLEFVMKPEADLSAFVEDGESSMGRGPHKAADGRKVVSALMPGMAASMFRKRGFVPRLRGAAPPPGWQELRNTAAAPSPYGCTWPYTSDRYPAYDASWFDRVTVGMRTTYVRRYAAGGGIVAQLQALAAQDPAHIKVVQVGTTDEGRPIVALRIGKVDPVNPVPVVALLGDHHAREWITVETAMRVARDVVNAYILGGTGYAPYYARLWRDALDSAAVMIMPVVNPDGYQFTHTTYRDWRKNRHINIGATNPNPVSESDIGDYGVDVNRNYDFMFDRWSSENPNGGVTRAHLITDPVYNGVNESPKLQVEVAAVQRALATAGEPKFNSSDLQSWGKNLPVLGVTMHSAAAQLVYPGGLRAPGVTAQNPSGTGIFTNQGAPTPDAHLFRELFGTWQTTNFVDSTNVFPGNALFTGTLRVMDGDSEMQNGYTTAGIFEHWSSYKDINPFPGLTVELSGGSSATNNWDSAKFFVECLPESDQSVLLQDAQAQVENNLLENLQKAPGLALDAAGGAGYARTAPALGMATTAGLVRERYGEPEFVTSANTSVPARFVVDLHRSQAGTGSTLPPSFVSSLNFEREVTGARYVSFGAPVDARSAPSSVYLFGGSPGFATFFEALDGNGAVASSAVNLCDPNRLPKYNASLQPFNASNPSLGCIWKATNASGSFDVPAQIPAIYSGYGKARCDLSFAVDENSNSWGGGSTHLEIVDEPPDASRRTWRWVTGWRYPARLRGESRTSQGPRTYSYEVWRQGEAFAKRYRFMMDNASSPGILDPVIYCRQETSP